MDVVTGTDTSGGARGLDPLLAGVRRLTLLADERRRLARRSSARSRASCSRRRAREEVHVHHLAAPGAEEDSSPCTCSTATAALSYLLPRAERPPGVSWVREHRAQLPGRRRARARRQRAAPRGDGHDQLRAAAAARRARRGRGGRDARAPRRGGLRRSARSSSRARSSTRRRPRSRSCARAPRPAPTRSPAA